MTFILGGTLKMMEHLKTFKINYIKKRMILNNENIYWKFQQHIDLKVIDFTINNWHIPPIYILERYMLQPKKEL